MAEKKTLADYETNIHEVANLLANDPDMQTFFRKLTPGYQREWARYIFGVKSETTKDTHIENMKTVFAAGFKSKRAYDQRTSK